MRSSAFSRRYAEQHSNISALNRLCMLESRYKLDGKQKGDTHTHHVYCLRAAAGNHLMWSGSLCGGDVRLHPHTHTQKLLGGWHFFAACETHDEQALLCISNVGNCNIGYSSAITLESMRNFVYSLQYLPFTGHIATYTESALLRMHSVKIMCRQYLSSFHNPHMR